MIQAYGDRIIAKVIDDVGISSIIITPTTEPSNKAKVLSVGNGRKLKNGSIQPLLVNIDDIIIFERGKEIETVMNDKNVIILKEENVICVVSQ